MDCYNSTGGVDIVSICIKLCYDMKLLVRSGWALVGAVAPMVVAQAGRQLHVVSGCMVQYELTASKQASKLSNRSWKRMLPSS